jgi:hypothetical protein
MLLLNVSFGIFAFLPQGWVFMILIMLLESWLMSRWLCKKKLDQRITGTVFLSNFISGLIGIIVTMILNGGWLLVVWFPWVSSHEIDLSQRSELLSFVIAYFIAFVLSVLIEAIINWLILRKHYPRHQILKSTLLANVVSYLIGSLILYAYSFGFLF